MCDVEFGPTVAGVFLERLSRFHVRVAVGDETVLAHLPNSGRLHELLVPGAAVRLARRERPGRLTAFDLVLVARPGSSATAGAVAPGSEWRAEAVDRAKAAATGEDLAQDSAREVRRAGAVDRAEPAPSESPQPRPTIAWAAVDARLPPRIVAAAAARGAIPCLDGYELVAREPRLGGGRADLLVRGPGGLALVETKSITLVEDGVALFPDSPTSRGARHLAELAARRDLRRLVVFVVQRDDARVVRPNTPADPVFGAAFRRALEAGVEVLGLRCRADEAGIRVLDTVPVETYDPAAAVAPLPDHLRPGLRLLVVGLNPGHYSAWHRSYFARPGNRFWPAMRAAGIVPPTAGPGSEAWLCRTRRIGFTDVVKRPTRSIDELDPAEWAAGAERVRQLVARFRPGAVAFVGLRGARAVLGPGIEPGPQSGSLGGVPVFVLPSTSGRQAAYRPREIVAAAREFARWLTRLDRSEGARNTQDGEENYSTS
ncbi:MAG TPA: DNA/RNA nuclease SfsA [Candidatus Binatia bacterium]|nr:DNA/RNA nuclease SfsA [Candidatus Binatia bacterium]